MDFNQPVVRLVGRVVLEHIEDEAFLDGLPHAVEMERLGFAVRSRPAENLQRLVLRRGREGEEADIGLLPSLGHGLEDFFLIVGQAFLAVLRRPLP